jgi:hypothetical protein
MIPTRPIDREQVETEARAKTFWGDSREEVLKFVMMQGFSAVEATELVNTLFQERAEEIRAAGIKKICLGIVLMAVPVATWILFVTVIHIIFIKVLALTIMAGLYGTYCLLKGLIMFFSPKSEPGDVGDK